MYIYVYARKKKIQTKKKNQRHREEKKKLSGARRRKKERRCQEEPGDGEGLVDGLSGGRVGVEGVVRGVVET